MAEIKRRPEAQYEAMAVAVATGKTIRAAAAEVGVAESTAYRWSTEELFKSRVRELLGQTTRKTMARLVNSQSMALKQLRKLAKDDDAKVSLAAAVQILKLSLQYLDQVYLLSRIEALEESDKKESHVEDAVPESDDSGEE